MTLIQDALKRNLEEASASSAHPTALPKEKKKELRLKPILTVAIFLIVMGTLGSLGWNLIQKSLRTKRPNARQVTQNIPMPLRPIEQQKSLTQYNEPTIDKQKENSSITDKAPTPQALHKDMAPINPTPWPTIVLAGVGTAPNGRLAIINGKVMREGQIVDGVTIISISSDKVIVEYQGDVRSLTAGPK